MAETDRDLLLGRLAVHFKLLTKERLVAALTHFRRAGSTLDMGTFLVAEDYLEPGDLGKLIKARDQYEARRREQAQAEAPQAPAAAPAPAAPVAPQAPPVAPAAPATPAAPITRAPTPVAIPATAADPPAAGDSSPQPVDAIPAVATDMPALVTEDAPPPEEPLELVMDDAGPTDGDRGPSLELERGVGLLAFQPGDTMDDLLRHAVNLGASDLHVHSGAPLKVRLHGRLTDADSAELPREEADRLVAGVLDADQRERLAAERQIDFSYALPGVGRFRANAYHQQRGVDAVFRAIPPTPPTLEGLSLPSVLESMTHHQQGLVLLTGPAGCGKSSTMAAMVELINGHRHDHILTVEDPIEQVFASKRCLVNQRQVGPHTQSFARALRAALREDPDIIVIGELRDLETISLALTAAETGHLVLGTLHTSSALRTINRLLGVFPSNQQAQVRTMVSESLRAIVSQRLLPRADGQGRVPACEILINNHAVGNLIRENKTHQIRSVMQTSAGQGMCLLDAALADLLRAGTISREDAREHADEPDKLP